MNKSTGFNMNASSSALPPNWSTMIPDLMVALVTGVAVGVAILVVERMSASKAEKRKLEQLGTRLVHPLLLVLQRPVYFPRLDQIGELPKKQREALKILEGPDLDDWHDTSPTSLTKSLIKYRSALRDQRHDREDLAQTLRDWERIHGDEPEIVAYSEACLLDANEQALRDLFPNKTERTRLEIEFKRVREHGHVKSHARAFRGARARSERAQQHALKELVERMKATAPAAPRRSRRRDS